MKKFSVLLCAFAGLLFSACGGGEEGWKRVDGVIVFDTPEREPGQKSVLGLRTAPMETVRVGFIGLGMRGPGAVERFTHLDGVEIKALCDLYPERVESAPGTGTPVYLTVARRTMGQVEQWKKKSIKS